MDSRCKDNQKPPNRQIHTKFFDYNRQIHTKFFGFPYSFLRHFKDKCYLQMLSLPVPRVLPFGNTKEKLALSLCISLTYSYLCT